MHQLSKIEMRCISGAGKSSDNSQIDSTLNISKEDVSDKNSTINTNAFVGFSPKINKDLSAKGYVCGGMGTKRTQESSSLSFGFYLNGNGFGFHVKF